MLIPCNYRAIVKHKEIEEKTAGGIVLPEMVRQNEKLQTTTGVVISLGPTAKEDTTAEVGDLVVYARHGGRFIKDPTNGVEYTILNSEDILCVIKESEDSIDG